MKLSFFSEKGYTLIEILAAVAIFTTVCSLFLSIFLQAFDFSKGNQSKSVGIQAARNAVHYLETIDFDIVQSHVDQTISASDCGEVDLFPSIEQCRSLLSPVVNNVEYNVELSIEGYSVKDLGIPNELSSISDTLKAMKSDSDSTVSNLFVQTRASIDWEEGHDGRETSQITGYVMDERLR
ncbi:type II secretion system protein [Pontibacillus salicampi]|uniref:Type II secretion system protein n=1 Tax=Pontibacillus salicampi TaxID=1449801 RepID=A0ABV6LJ73_9BACI